MADEEFDVATFRRSMQHFTWIDYSVFILMLTVCGGIGVYFGFVKKQKSTQDYLLGGRNMKSVPVCFSLVASFISGISLLGTPTELYVYGTAYLFFLIGAFLMSFIMFHTFLPVLHELRLTSVYEYLELRFDKRLRIFGSVIFSVYLMAWLPIVVYVPALAFNQVTGINIHIVTPIVCCVCIFYTCLGGLKAVVWTDVIQTIVMVLAMILVIIKGTINVGGLQTVLERNWDTGRLEFPTLSPDLTVRHTILSVSIGSTFYWIGNIAVNQSMMQRFLSLPDLKISKRVVWGFLGGIICIIFVCAYSGLLAVAWYFNCDPLNSRLALAKDQLLPLLVMDVFAEWKGLSGLFVAGVFSAALSSLSTGLNSMAAVVLEDFWKPFFKKLTHKQTQVMIRAVVVILGAVCVGLVFVVEKLGSVLQLTMSLSSASMGPLTGVFLMGIFLPFVDSTSALVGGILGLTSSWWLATQSQIAQASGALRFNEKPRFTQNCSYSFDPVVHKEETLDMDVFYLYRISYLWFTAFGCVITLIIASALSLRSTSYVHRDPKLFAPVIRSWITKNQRVKEINLDNQS
ncbi:sodium-coupled monocarboxylate transporter 1-like isoform X1 [Ostrinia furnacalis]|uniref:sodium-coupled monocarboxylate transporter 1-like isoform X1 n=2 Tax=Ostrinia furnacalis TaxID=93504 RepID=UPI00103BDAB1|nr:sodium-coupled monocarboxylate transporter 1-like isoform X1 [Ostrinia furnacalis]